MYRGDNVRRHWLGISVVIIVCALVIAFLAIRYIKPNPAYLFRRRFGFDLPKSAVVLNYTYTSIFDDAPQLLIQDDHMYIKVALPNTAYEELIDKLNEYFSGQYYEKRRIDEFASGYLISGFRATALWWDLNKDDIVLAYSRFESGSFVKTREVYAFLVLDASGQYYLYAAD
jgi:hypothetical protein